MYIKQDYLDMSRTKHHGIDNHIGHDYGGRYNCNKGYGASYGKDSRDKADSERRMEDKRVVIEELQCLAA